MGVDDREWMRDGRRISGRDWDPVVLKALVALNVAVFLIGFFFPETWGALIDEYGAYSAYGAFVQGRVWELVTYQFLHASIGHIVFNMICLWVFGGAVERMMGHGKFLAFYLVCGIAAALFSSLLAYWGLYELPFYYNLQWYEVPMVGASGSIYGVIAAAAILFPHARIALLFPPIEMSVRTFAFAILGIAVAYIIFNWQNAGGEAGHMGGMLMGFLLMGAGRMIAKLKQSS